MYIFVLLCLWASWIGMARGSYTWCDELKILPSLTDGNISTPSGPGFGDHEVFYNASREGKYTRLFLFIGGAFTEPDNYRYVLNTAAKMGLLAVGLAHDNPSSIFLLCLGGGFLQADCQIKSHKEVIDGENHALLVDVSYHDSVMNRLKKLLVYLDEQKGIDTSNFLDAETGELDWSHVVVGGHAQGAGTAQVIAAMFEVERVILIAGGFLVDVHDFPIEKLTPRHRFYALCHFADDLLNLILLILWHDILGIVEYGGIKYIDPPHNCTLNSTDHTLVATVGVSIGFESGVVALDSDTLIEATIPVFEPVWAHMIGTQQEIDEGNGDDGDRSGSSSSSSAPEIDSLFS